MAIKIKIENNEINVIGDGYLATLWLKYCFSSLNSPFLTNFFQITLLLWVARLFFPPLDQSNLNVLLYCGVVLATHFCLRSLVMQQLKDIQKQMAAAIKEKAVEEVINEPISEDTK